LYVQLSRFQVVVLPFLFVGAAFAQAPRKLAPKDLPPEAFKLIEIKTTGTKRYKPEEIVAASGLQIGQTASEDDFKKAARLLGDSGAFGDVQYSFSYSAEGTKLELQLQDAQQFVPVRFDNLVWFSDQELLDQAHAQVPLFQGQLPVGGDLADQVSTALQNLMIARNLQGRVDYLRATAGEDGPIEAFVFSVTGPRIQIRNVVFSGASAPELALLEGVAKKMQGADFSRSILRVQEDKDFLPIYLARGYLKAALGDAEAKVIQEGAHETSVDVTFAVDPGRQYKLDGVNIAGTKSLDAEALMALTHAQFDQPANAVQLDSDIVAMKKLYGTRGFMAAKIQPNPEFDDAASTVKYVLLIREGDVYTMGDLEIRGLDSHTTARLEDDWKLRGGDTYDSSYPKKFLEQVNKEISLLGDWNTSVRESVNAEEKTVDVSLRFDPKSR